MPMSGDADVIRVVEEEHEFPMSAIGTRVGVIGIRGRRSIASKGE